LGIEESKVEEPEVDVGANGEDFAVGREDGFFERAVRTEGELALFVDVDDCKFPEGAGGEEGDAGIVTGGGEEWKGGMEADGRDNAGFGVAWIDVKSTEASSVLPIPERDGALPGGESEERSIRGDVEVAMVEIAIVQDIQRCGRGRGSIIYLGR